MADDLDELTSLGNVQPVAKVRGRPRRGARQQQQQQQQLEVLADAEPEVQDLVELAAIAAAPPRRHEQRSWQHAEQARTGKTAKRLAAKAADADAKRRRSVRGDPHRGFDLSLGGHSSRPYCQVGPDGRSTEFGYLEIGCGTRLARCSLEVSGKFASSCCWVVVARHREIATVRDAASCRTIDASRAFGFGDQSHESGCSIGMAVGRNLPAISWSAEEQVSSGASEHG